MKPEFLSPLDLRRLVRRPFKGTYFYEWQIGPFVFQWRHAGPMRDASLAMDLGFPKMQLWRDPYWRRRV